MKKITIILFLFFIYVSQIHANFSICLDPGHGGPGAGKWTGNNGDGHGAIGPNNLTEVWINHEIASILHDAFGMDVYCTQTRTDLTEQLTMTDRVNRANASECDLLFSIHHNGIAGGQDWSETFCGLEPYSWERSLRAITIDEIISAWGYGNHNRHGVRLENGK